MDGINIFDSTVMAAVQESLHNVVTDTIFPVITYLGEGGVIWLALSVVMLFFKKTRRGGICALCAIAVGFLAGEIILKNIVCRPRPFQTFPEYARLLIAEPSGWSFPSGHSCSSFAAATALLLNNRKIGAPALILAILIAFSRVFLFVHWPSDILVGATLGILTAVGVQLLAGKLQNHREEKNAE